MIDIAKGRYWGLPWSLVSGCTPCSPGCEHCWALAMERRFRHPEEVGRVQVRPDRLDIPLRRRKPTVYAVWNDLFNEAVPDYFIREAINAMTDAARHTFLVLTKRPERMERYFRTRDPSWPSRFPVNVYAGLTVCNQQEADEKIPVILQVPGKKFLSIEPMLERMSIEHYLWLTAPTTAGPWRDYTGHVVRREGGIGGQMISRTPSRYIDAVILGGETGPGARPMHPDWVRKVRDDCAAAGVPFFFKGWGKWEPTAATPVRGKYVGGGVFMRSDGKLVGQGEWWNGRAEAMDRFPGMKKAGRLLDGRTHDDLPWLPLGCGGEDSNG